MQTPRALMQKAPSFRSSAAFSPCNPRWVHVAEQQQQLAFPTWANLAGLRPGSANSSLRQPISKALGLPVEFRHSGVAT